MQSTFHIAIDGNEANVAERVGSNAYAFEILKHLEKILHERWESSPEENKKDLPEVKVSVLLSAPPQTDLPPERSGWKYEVFGPTAFWTQYALPWYLFKHRKEIDVFYTPGHYAPRLSSVPYVSSVMDLAFLQFPEQFKEKDYLQLKEWTRYSVKHAQKVIAISEYTKADVVKNYRIDPEKVVVAYPSVVQTGDVSYKEKAKIAVFKKWQIKQPYLLYVGTLQPRKNLVRLIEAFEKLHADKDLLKAQELRLVIAGKTGWLANDILQKIEKSPFKAKIILTGYIMETEKIILYKGSLCTVLVGLYEGFGMPALEAMRYGSIPVVSATTSLPEVVGNAGILVDPEQVSDIKRGLAMVISLPAKERGKLLRNGRQQLKKFDWTKSAQVVLETLISCHK